MKRFTRYVLSIFCILTLSSTQSFAAIKEGPEKVKRPPTLSCKISVTPNEVACGQGTATLKLDASATVCTDSEGNLSDQACPDLSLVWRTLAPGPDGGVAQLEQQGATITSLTVATHIDGVSLESFEVQLVAVSVANNLKVVCDKTITVGECSHDCNGVLGGSAVEDACGVCGGDGSSCTDCDGVPNGDAVEDACGVCGGDGTSCLDCPQGIDECGICGGDNTSCLQCDSIDISPSQFELDGAAQHMNDLVAKGVRALRRATGKSSGFKKLLNTAHEAYLQSWTTIWSFESTQLSNCSSDALCSLSDNSGKKQAYIGSLETLLQEASKQIRRKLKRSGKRKLANKLWKQAKNQYEIGKIGIENIPDTQEECN